VLYLHNISIGNRVYVWMDLVIKNVQYDIIEL
jgi:hypothetical protein